MSNPAIGSSCRKALTDSFCARRIDRSRLAPLNGAGVYAAPEAESGCGLLDRFIADDYRRAGLITLTLDRKMAALRDVRSL